MNELFSLLNRTGHRFLLQTYSALDRYYGKKNISSWFFITDAPLSLFATLFDDVIYRGTDESDVVITDQTSRYYFQCIDSFSRFDPFDRLPRRAFTLQNLYYDILDDYYIDTVGMYADLRSRTLIIAAPTAATGTLLKDAALLVAHYNLKHEPEFFHDAVLNKTLSVYEQHFLLTSLLSSDSPDKGFTLLKESGFIEKYWPELDVMSTVGQTKDHHPEGNVWNHIIEALQYRKSNDPLLAFGILLHDIGKTMANGTRENPYQNHTDHGVFLAGRFLRRLDYGEDFIQSVIFLVKNHMMPDALPRMPLYRIEKLLLSPLFPTLLELFRADLLSTFQGPEKYYEACRIYRSFLKTRGNPFKSLPLNKRIVV